MMLRRKLWLAVAVLVVAGVATTPILGAGFFRAHVEPLSAVATIGTTTPVLVDVDPALLGGTADLYAKTQDGRTLGLRAFILTEPTFVLQAPVPPDAGQPGELIQFFFRSHGPDGGVVHSSLGAPVLLTKGEGTDEPPIWD